MLACQHITYKEYCEYVYSQGRDQVLPERLWNALKAEAAREVAAEKDWVCEAHNMVGEEFTSGPMTKAESAAEMFNQDVTKRWSYIRSYKSQTMPHVKGN